jgi:hypothetical protein
MAEESRYLTYSDIRGLRPLPMLAHFVLDESTQESVPGSCAADREQSP